MKHDLFESAIQKGAQCGRLTSEEAYSLIAEITPDHLHRIGEAAFFNRNCRFQDRATYVFNIQINPANICYAGCTFCNYAASKNDPHAYVLSEEAIYNEIERLEPVEAHIVGGLNSVWPYERNLNLVKELRKRYPLIHIKAFTAVEIHYFSQTSKKSPKQILLELQDAGLDSMPGGGAEIFSDRLYKIHWNKKIGPDRWIEIHQLAHSISIPTNATMLFGFGDTWEERISHLLKLRSAQDESHGFTCFIPLAFQPGRTQFIEKGPTPLETLYVMGISRLVLDNIPHVKSYWPMVGLDVAAAGLSFGADDMDGTITEEKIAHAGGATTPVGLARESMEETIRMAGFIPVERDGRFNERRGK